MARVVVLGAAGFLGSHLCDRLVARGDEVVGIDNLSSSSGANLERLKYESRFTFLESDIVNEIPVAGNVDAILNFASPASPPRYLAMPIQTLLTGSQGTDNALRFSLERGARFIMASTSEIYGDPTVSPQPEEYWGNVNPVGVRSCYDEAKRYAEALCVAYRRELSADVGIIRIFNTYGPRLGPLDGRVVSNFISQSIRGRDLTVYGAGTQTRSFCYVEDQINGIIAMLDSKECGPINIGNPVECTMLELAAIILDLTKSNSKVVYHSLPADDPLQRCPDITKAKDLLGWEPAVDLQDGLQRTIDWFRESL